MRTPHTGGTTVYGGTLLVDNTRGSGVGTGPVQAILPEYSAEGGLSLAGTRETGREQARSWVLVQFQLFWDANDWEATHTQIRCTYRVTLNSDTPAADQGDRQRVFESSGRRSFLTKGAALRFRRGPHYGDQQHEPKPDQRTIWRFA